jgi:hypothetical protein
VRLTVVPAYSAPAGVLMLVCCLVLALFSLVFARQLGKVSMYRLGVSVGFNTPRVDFFSVKVFRNPKLIESGLFPLSDCPLLPYPLALGLIPY